MTKRTVPDLKELFKQASEIAQQVPESMQEAAFNRALDLLTGSLQSPLSTSQPARQPSAKQRLSQKKLVKNGSEDRELAPSDTLLNMIDSTQHPGIRSANKILDRSLMVLQIALDDHGVDGLTPNDIAKLLTDKFRISTTSAAVSNSLGKATTLVNRVSSGPGFVYRIMGPGEEYLAHLDQPGNVSNQAKPSKAKKRRSSKNSEKHVAKETEEKENPKKSQKAASKSPGQKTPSKGEVGPKAAVLELIASGFFSQPRTGPAVQAQLKNKRGFNIGTDQLRLAMLRLVRDQKLDRDDHEGQYEYSAPST
jgi:hypothetical protein